MERGWRNGSATSMCGLDRSRSFGNLPGAVAVGYRAGQGSGRYRWRAGPQSGEVVRRSRRAVPHSGFGDHDRLARTGDAQIPDAGRRRRAGALSAENGANRSRLERYLVNLAADQEQQLQVMDSEAQRCRALLTAPASRPGKDSHSMPFQCSICDEPSTRICVRVHQRRVRQPYLREMLEVQRLLRMRSSARRNPTHCHHRAYSARAGNRS